MKELQYYDVENYFKKIDKVPTQIYIENFDSTLDDYKDIKGDPVAFKEFLKKNNENLMKKVDLHFISIDEMSNKGREKFLKFRSHFGIDKLRKDYLEKIYIPTCSQIDDLIYTFKNGFKVFQETLVEEYQKFQSYHKAKFGENYEKLHQEFSQNRPVFTTDTSFQTNITQEDLEVYTKNAFDEYKSLKFDGSLERLLENQTSILEKWEKILKGKDRGNDKPFLDFKNSTMRLKGNLFELSKIIPFKQITEDQYKLISNHLFHSTSG